MGRNRVFSALAALAVLAVPQLARAQALYSVDYGTDELVRIDPKTGKVTVIGALGRDAYDVDLAVLGGRLYALDSHPYDHADLLRIDWATGAATFLGALHGGGYDPVQNAEGLTAHGGRLYAGYASLLGHFGSNVIASVDLTGALTDVYNFFPVLRDADFDGLGNGFDGALLASDNKQTFGVLLNRVTVANPGSYGTLGFTFVGADACCGRGDDLDFVGLRLYEGNGLDGTISRVDPNDGSLLSLIQLDRPPVGAYAGLANGPAPSCAPLALGSWRRSCQPKDPNDEYANMSAYADDVREFAPFGGLAGSADLCARLKPAGGDKCAQAEAQFLALLLNLDSLRLGRDCCADSAGPTVNETFAQVWTLLQNPQRAQADCTIAQGLANGINSGSALCP